MRQPYRYRVKYQKKGSQKWLSHLDTVRAIERGLRRAQLPVSFTGGFSPHPKMSFGQALSLGIESYSEYVDFELTDEVGVRELIDRVNKVSPATLAFTAAVKLSLNSLSLGKAVKFATYGYELSKLVEADAVKKNIMEATYLTEGIIKFKSESGDEEISIKSFDLRTIRDITHVAVTVPINTSPKKLYEGINLILKNPLVKNKITRLNQWSLKNDCLNDPIDDIVK